MNKFKELLARLKDENPTLIEAIQTGYTRIFESTEDAVTDVKNMVTKKCSDCGRELSESDIKYDVDTCDRCAIAEGDRLEEIQVNSGLQE